MSDRPLRFIHAGDFHLEQPFGGLPEVPDHLGDALIDAPYVAAERVFDTAIAEEVDFVVLAGDVFHPHAAGPRAIVFLAEQLARLAEREIAVYWTGGCIDPPGRLPPELTDGPNVHIFPKGKVEEVTHYRGGRALATVMGSSYLRRRKVRAADFQADPAGQFCVAVAYGEADPETLAKRGIHYWALGGSHRRRTLFSGRHAAHYAGTPQGRSPDETGPAGCTLVTVDRDAVGTQFVPTDSGRWHNERIELSDSATPDELRGMMHEKMQNLVENSPDRFLLVGWTIVAAGPVATALRRGGLAAELVERLRREFGYRMPAAWTAGLNAEGPASLPGAWYEEETILGDFLSGVRRLQRDADEPIRLDPYLSEAHAAGTMADAVALSDEATRSRVLRQAAMLGIDLLRPEPPVHSGDLDVEN